MDRASVNAFNVAGIMMQWCTTIIASVSKTY